MSEEVKVPAWPRQVYVSVSCQTGGAQPNGEGTRVCGRPGRCSRKCHVSKNIGDTDFPSARHTQGCSSNIYPGWKQSSYIPDYEMSKRDRQIQPFVRVPSLKTAAAGKPCGWMESLLSSLSWFTEAKVTAWK